MKSLNKFFTRGLETTFLLFVIFAVAASAAAPTMILTKPAKDASLPDGNIEFGFIPRSDTTGPLTCELYVDNVKTGEISAVGGFPASILATIERGSHSWLVSCTDENIEKGESESRNFNVPLQEAPQQETLETLKGKTSAVVTGFSVLSGAVTASESQYLQAWHSVVGDSVSFSANASNTGESVFTASLEVKIKNFGTEELAAVTRSKPVSVAPGESIKLSADWISLKEGEYYAEGSVIDENEKVFQTQFVKIVVSSRSAAGETAMFMAVLCVIIVAVASYATKKNMRNVNNA